MGFLLWLGICAAVGFGVNIGLDSNILGWASGVCLFVLGLPGLLISDFLHGLIDHHNDRADERAYWEGL